MSDAQRVADENEILRIRRLWAFSRDQGDWETVKMLFHPGATVSISWFAGTAEGFIEASKMMFGAMGAAQRSKHWFGNHRVSLNGARALLEIDVEVRGRDYIGEHLFDFTYQERFFDRFEKRAGAWKITQWTCIYDKDRFDPVVPGCVPASFFDGLKLDGPESGIAFMRFRQLKGGRPAAAGIVIGGSESEARLKHAGEAWLAQG